MMNITFNEGFSVIYDNVKKQKPLIHHLTNYVTAGDCANIAL